MLDLGLGAHLRRRDVLHTHVHKACGGEKAIIPHPHGGRGGEGVSGDVILHSRHYDFRGSDTLFSGRVMLKGWSHTGARKHKQQLSVILWNSADKDFPVWKILLNISTHCTLTRNSKHPISSPLANIAYVSVQ